MVRTVKIENFKSIFNLELELGRFNVFIGENGSGKSNLLEAFAMASAGQGASLIPETLYAKGIRVTRPSLTYTAFKDVELRTDISIELNIETEGLPVSLLIKLTAEDPNRIEATWSNPKTQALLLELSKIEEDGNSAYEHVQEIISQKEIDENARKALIDKASAPHFELTKKLLSIATTLLAEQPASIYLRDFVIYALNTASLRGIFKDSIRQPLGIHGENLDVHIHQLSSEVRDELKTFYKYIQWLGDVEVDVEDRHKSEGYKLGKSTSQLFFIDKYLNETNNLMSAESANEGVLFLLFYLVLFLSPQTPKFFAIDNIEQALNPRLARVLITELARLAKEKNKQALITTHDPAILDGLNLYDDEQRLFVVSRADNGATTVNRIKLNGEAKRDFKLSEMWMRGSLGAVPTNF